MDTPIVINQDDIRLFFNRVSYKNPQNCEDTLRVIILRNEYYKYIEPLYPKVLCNIIIEYVHDVCDLKYNIIKQDHYEPMFHFVNKESNIDFKLFTAYGITFTSLYNYAKKREIIKITCSSIATILKKMNNLEPVYNDMSIINEYVATKYNIHSYLSTYSDEVVNMKQFIKHITNQKEFEMELMIIKELIKNCGLDMLY